MHKPSRLASHLVSPLLALAALLQLAGCLPSSAQQLGHKLVVHGVVTDAATGEPLAGVKVSLLSLDDFPAQATDARGYFQFSDVLQLQNLLVQFQLAGYATVTLPVNSTLLEDGGTTDGGATSFPGFGSDVDGFDASVALAQVLSAPVSGMVWAGAAPAAGAQVELTTLNGTPAYQTKAAADGTFSFAAVRAGTWQLVVLPWDRDNDGLADTQFFQQAISVAPGSSSDLGHLAIQLAEVQKALVASSFVALSRAYPITPAQLLAGVSGVLQATGGTLFLAFGAEVDPALTSFQLVQFEAGGARFSPPIALTASWSHGSIVQLTPGAMLQASDSSSVGYQLRITALRFADGTVGIPASSTSFGTINFSVQALPQPLANPTPSLYLASALTATQAAAKAVFDADTGWLLDANGDFVFDTVASANWSPANPIQLQWPSVPGAVGYHLYMRNTTSPGNGAAGSLDWVEQTNLSLSSSDPNLAGTVVASNVSPWALGLGSSPAAGPWAFGNHVQFAVASQDALGFIAPLDTNKLLDTADAFGGLLTGAAFDAAAPVPFAAATELGDTFIKTLRLTFSEPMLTSAVPALAALGPRVALRKVLASGWSNGGAPASALTSATQAYLSLQLAAAGSCTEVLVARSAGDTLLAVRDATYFTTGATSSLALLSPAGQFLLEADGIAAVSSATGQLTLAAPLPAGAQIPQGALACSLQGAGTTTASASAGAAGTALTVGNANLFAVGDAVLYYEPQGASPPVADVARVAGVDSAAKLIVLQAAPGAGHTAASLLLPLPPSGAEISLRGSQTLSLARDVAGGAGAQLVFAAAVPGIAVGDALLLDADGDLKTTVDQVQVKVAQVSFAPQSAPAVYALTADLPSTLTLLHGRSKVIALGDAFMVSGTKDTSGNGGLDPHRDQFTPDGFLY